MNAEPAANPYTHFNPITVQTQETAGIIMLGILAMTLLLALLRAQARNRELAERLHQALE